MAVEIDSLLRYLSDYKPVSSRERFDEVRTFRLLNSGLKHFDPDCLYIGKTSQLPAAPPSGPVPFLLIRDSDTARYDGPDNRCPCIYVAPSTDLTALYNSIQDYFENEIYVSECALKIMQLSKSSSNLQQVMDLGYELLGNPLLLVDVSLCFIAHAGGNTVRDEPLWEWTLSKGYVTDEYVNSILEDGYGDEEKEAKKPLLIWEKGLLNHDQLVFRILSNNTPVGYLKTLAYNKPISETDQKIITLIGNSLCPFLVNKNADRASCSPLIESFLISLLNQKLYDRNAIDERMHQFNLKMYDNIVLIVIELKDMFLHDKDKAYLFKRKLQNFLGRDNIVYYDGHLVALYDYKRASRPFAAIEWKNFESMLDFHKCRAGVSMEFHDLYSLPEHYRSACDALYTNWKLHLSNTITRYDDIILRHAFLVYANRTDLTPLIHPAFRILEEKLYDKYPASLKTIKAYIDHGMKIAPTAKALCVHYNTAKYRLSRIVELTGLNFGDAKTVFQLQLSFLIMDMQQRLKQSGKQSGK